MNTVRRLESTVKQLRKEPDVLKECDSIVKDQLEKGIIEEVEVKKPVEPRQVHYLPGQIFTRKDALTTKIRMVFDASSKSHEDLYPEGEFYFYFYRTMLKRLKKRTLFLRNFTNYFETRRFMNSCRNVRLLGDLF